MQQLFIYSPDTQGNVLSATEAFNGATTRYTYDQYSLLTSMTNPRGLAKELQTETDAQGRLLRDYVWANGMVVAQVNVSTGSGRTTSEQLVYLYADHLHTPRVETDVAGRIVWRWEEDAFGATAADTDPDGDGTKTQVALRFPGQYWDAESGWHYNWHRYYEPQTGRYLTSDRIGLDGGMNTYGYALQNPSLYSDPHGLDAWAAIGGQGSVFLMVGYRFTFSSVTNVFTFETCPAFIACFRMGIGAMYSAGMQISLAFPGTHCGKDLGGDNILLSADVPGFPGASISSQGASVSVGLRPQVGAGAAVTIDMCWMFVNSAACVLTPPECEDC